MVDMSTKQQQQQQQQLGQEEILSASSMAKEDKPTTMKKQGTDQIGFVPSHTAKERVTRYDWLNFLVPALFYKVTPIGPLYLTAITRMLVTHIILSLHYTFVDKKSYLNKISAKQLKRERDDYFTAYIMHMWSQVALQLLFPGMFFSDAKDIPECMFRVFMAHVFVVEPLYYFVHRWLHAPKQMKAMHGFHHLSISTLPSTSLVQNFREHMVYICTFGPAFLGPYFLFGKQHWVAIASYLLFFDIANSYGHTNIRVRSWLFTSRYSPFTYLFYTPEFHLGHHAYFNSNYTLFMPVWDILFGTYRSYQKKDREELPKDQQDFVFIGHNGGLGHFLTIPELSFYNIYNDYVRTWLPIKMEFLIMHFIAAIYRTFVSKLYMGCPRFCIANEYIGQIIVLARTPYDYLTPSHYNVLNKELLDCIKKEYKTKGTRYFGLGNLNKMKQLNDGGKEIVRMIQEDEYLRDKKIRIWTGDTCTVASVYYAIADIADLDAFYYIGAGGKVGTAVCELLTKSRPNLKIRIFSRNQVLDHPNITYSTDLKEMADYKVVLIGKFLSEKMYAKAMAEAKDGVQTQLLLDYTVPAMPIQAIRKHPANILHYKIGMLKTEPNNTFLKGYYDMCMGHPQHHIVPCHFGCILNAVAGRETDEVGDISLDEVEKIWKQVLARGFENARLQLC
ncbi:hypothetical protein ACA910_015913 [Epithemia clementina (nom. ined.)]